MFNFFGNLRGIQCGRTGAYWRQNSAWAAVAWFVIVLMTTSVQAAPKKANAPKGGGGRTVYEEGWVPGPYGPAWREYEVGKKFATYDGDIAMPLKVLRDYQERVTSAPLVTLGLKVLNDRAWPNAVVPYEIDDGFSSGQRQAIEDAIEAWDAQTIVNFRQKTDEDDPYVQFVSLGESDELCRVTYIGNPRPAQSTLRVLLPAKCTYGSILHEIGHALGLYHEQLRADAPSYVDVLEENLEEGASFKPYATGNEFNVDWGEYNYRSIMHYPAYASSVDKVNLDTLDPILDIPDGLMGQELERDAEIGNYAARETELTRGDISAVNSLYPSFIIPGDHNSLSWRWPARFSDQQATQFGTGDFDGDGLDDVVAFAKGFQGDANRGDVNVALSKPGGGFQGRQFWHGWFCINSESCEVADVNGDGRDDILAFTSTGTVWVALSQDVDGDGFGDRFAESSVWHSELRPAEQILLGDVDGDGDDDLVIVGEAASPGQPRSVGIYFSDLVQTASATGFSSNYTTRVFRDVQSEASITDSQFLMLGDVDGDGRADAVVAYEGNATSVLIVRRSVRSFVSWSSQAKFAAGEAWGQSVCGWGVAYCHLADMNDDGLADVVWMSGHLGRFVDGTSGPITSSHALERVQIQLSQGFLFARLPLYHEMDCRDRLWGCLLADVDGDGLMDVVDPIERAEESPTNHRYAGDIFVSTSTGIWTP